ncbi:MAG: hypothetical protein HPKKFMNG_02602 [Planctomycetes bacterium]|nr:hypothetical protein [Planctomycetota bacterium]MCQ3951064.1 hypothetical protein [Planctomycetota bacterium]GIK53774.1 MAG: hypothetical protein BroJett014_27470 [Planctomycetota bacterium]
MASVRDLQAKAKKLLATWKKQLDGGLLKKDESSPVTHLCMTILMRNGSARTATSALNELRKRFADWNEIRVSPIAEVEEVLEKADLPNARAKAFALRRFLRDLFSKYTKTNLNFDKIEIPEAPVVVAPKEGSAAAADDDEGDDDEPVSRESGLPPHPSVPGYVDGDKIMGDPIPLDPKLITEKNGIHVAAIAYDDCERGPFAALWKLSLFYGLVEPELDAQAALGRLRQVIPEKEPAAFAFYGMLHAREDWAEITKKADALREKYGPVDKEEAEQEDEAEGKKAKAKK